MAGFRIPGLPPITPPEVADDDALVLFDRSTNTTKQVPVGPALGDLLEGVITIPPGGGFALPPGTEPAPSLIWTDDADTGLYKPTPHEIGVSIDGVRQMSVGGTGVTIEGDLNVTGDITGGEGNFDERYVQKVETFTMGGPDAANMWPRLSSDGKLDASLLRASLTSYKGQIHAELVPPPAALNGDFYMQAVNGTTSASWGAAANMPINGGDFLSFSTVQGWQIVGSQISPEAYVKRDGDTMIGKLVTVDSKAAEAGFRLLPGVAPTAPLNGDMWADGTNFWGRAGGVTHPFQFSGTPLSLPPGSATAPSLVWTDHAYTGLYKIAPTEIGVTINGNKRVQFQDGGLFVYGGNAGVGNSPGGSSFGFWNTDYSVKYGLLGSDGANMLLRNHIDGDIRFINNGGVRMAIKSDGLVGIGTTAPGANLHVHNISTTVPTHAIISNDSGMVRLGVPPSGTAEIWAQTGKGMVFGHDNNAGTQTVRMAITSAGNVGIGNTGTGYRLAVSADAPGADGGTVLLMNPSDVLGTAASISFSAHSAGAITGKVAGYADAPSIYGMRFSTYGTAAGLSERMRITGDGAVGIGIFGDTAGPNPHAMLEVKGEIKTRSAYPGAGGTAASTGFFSHAINSGGSPVAMAGMQVGFGRLSDTDYSSNLRFHTSADNNPVERMRITSNGWVGIGNTTPDARLYVAAPDGTVPPFRLGGLPAGGGNAVDFKPYITGYNNGGFSLAVGGVDTFFIGSNQRVGIGVQAPASMLAVGDPAVSPASWSASQSFRINENTNNPNYYLKGGMYLDAGNWTGFFQQIANSNPAPLKINPGGGLVSLGNGAVGQSLHMRGSIIAACGDAYKIRLYDGGLSVEYGFLYHDSGTLELRNSVSGGATQISANGVAPIHFVNNAAVRCRVAADGLSFQPATAGGMNIGTGGLPWSVIFANTPTIQPSDQREKEPLAPLTEQELAAAKTIAQNIGSYRWLDTVKYDDNKHIGVIAQQVIAACEAQGLDALSYGFVRYDEWDEIPEYPGMPAREAQEADPEAGILATEADPGVAPVPALPAGNRYSVAYSELAMFIAAAQEQRLAEQEEVQVTLEARLAALERPRPRGPRN